jgi:hypothetical protein
MVELMQEWTRLKADDGGRDLHFALVVDAELFRLDAVIRWLDTADGRVERAGSLTAPSATRDRPLLPRRSAVRR